MPKETDTGVIVPDHAYSIVGLAKIIGREPRWVRENLVNTGEIPVTGRGQLMMGWAIIAWIERDMGMRDRDSEGG